MNSIIPALKTPKTAPRSSRPSHRRLLIVATNPNEGASTRVRMLQYLPSWQARGYQCHFHPFFSSQASSWLYREGHLLRKMQAVVRGAWQRTRLLRQAPDRYDALIVHRELYPLGFLWELRRLKRLGLRVIYDYDDAMFVPQRRDRPWLGKVERPASTADVIRLSDWVVAGNRFLAEYAQHIHERVSIIPSVVDTDRVVPRHHDEAGGTVPLIGWIGSHTTAKYVDRLAPVFQRVQRQCAFRLRIVGTEPTRVFDGLPVEHHPWQLAREQDEFAACDIGVYPLWDDAWAQGKCGFKAIQFMAAGVPVVASRVGLNCEIIEDGVNGFLVANDDEWVARLSQLLCDPSLRARLGAAGRRTVESRYSLRMASAQWAQVLETVCG